MKRLFLVIGLLTVISFVLGCGSSTNSVTARDPATSAAHQAGWLPKGHSVSAKSDITPCTTCHGSDLSGGIAGVSCTKCHIGTTTSIHPVSFNSYTWAPAGHAAYVVNNGNTSCSNVYCHGADLAGVDNSGPSCTSCHIGGKSSVHPASYNGNAWVPAAHSVYVNTNGNSSCSNIYCHAADLSGVANSGPSCTSCHLGGVGSVHPQTWTANILLHSTYVDSNGTSSCRNTVCHGADLKGVSLSGTSCFTCHQFALP
ncbi:MAG: hypothetical protein HQL08_14130 [Nitrospirae bacterium]|nr:hypothetical protein [Nitrospirota bacterium]